MELKDLISAISLKQGVILHAPASASTIEDFEKKIGFTLPSDFREFYSTCNGLQCDEDIFSIIPLEEIVSNNRHYGQSWFYFSEYMIYSDMWILRKTGDGMYEIVNDANLDVKLSNYLSDFLERFLTGNVFDKGGLYEWQEEMKTNGNSALGYNIQAIFSFLEDKIGCDREELAMSSDIVKDLGCYGDDLDEFMEEYSKQFQVDIAEYRWYFHNTEEGHGNSIGRLMFKSPPEKVKRIPITPFILLLSANKGKWAMFYPEHKLPKRRYDIWVNRLLVLIFIAFLVYKCAK